MRCTYCNKVPEVGVNTDYQVPYVAGYSQDGAIVYIDKRLPKCFIDTKGNTVDVYKYLFIHEVTEKALKDELNLSYNRAHSLAIATQAQALTMDNINYDEYYAFLQSYINYDIQPEDFDDVPPDLDVSPYIEDGKIDVVSKIKRLQKMRITNEF